MEQNRVPKGVRTAGQFAPGTHAEPDIALSPAAPRPAQLDGWPPELKAPQLSFSFMADGQLQTWVGVGDELFPVHTADYTTGRTCVEIEPGSPLDHDKYRDRVTSWAAKAHLEFEDGLRKEMILAALTARHRVAAKVTGIPAQLDDSDLSTLMHASFKAGDEAVRQGEAAAVSLAARRVRKLCPEAEMLEVRTVEHSEGISVSAIAALDADGRELDVFERWTDDEDEELYDVVKNIEAGSTVWDDFRPESPGSRFDVVDIRRAAGWSPGATG